MSGVTDHRYSNFVKASTESCVAQQSPQNILRGEDARRLYLEEVKDIRDPQLVQANDFTYHKTKLEEVKDIRDPEPDRPNVSTYHKTKCYQTRQTKRDVSQFTDKDLILSAQNNDVNTLKRILDISPDKINSLDDYGWSLLMIACQGNAKDTAKELLARDVDTSIRDKAGNSAQSLVIRNKNYELATLLTDHKSIKRKQAESHNTSKKVKFKQEYICELCNNKFYDRDEHYSSTVHNINACKGRKIPTNYVIPSSNKGYQLMLKGGWDRESGLGPDGSGNKYPIKVIQKKDRIGLGHKKKKEVMQGTKLENKESFRRACDRNRNIEINFRREFY